MNAPAFDCICAGIVVADHICEPVDHLPAAGQLVITNRMELSLGGCASNVAVDLARLGQRVAVVGRVGDDAFGSFACDELRRAGVDCRHLIASPTAETSGTLVINVRGEDRRFIHSTGANAEFDGSDVTPEIIAGGRVLYLGGYCLSATLSPGNVAAMFQRARTAGVTTVLDVVVPQNADYWPLLEPVLPWTDVFFPNNDEAAAITGLSDPLRQAEAFHRAGARTAVVTCGADGAVLVSDNLKLRASAYPVEFIDGTGSGDAFGAGYIYGLLSGADAAGCLAYGSALGASCVGCTGATPGVFDRRQLEEFLAAHELGISRL